MLHSWAGPASLRQLTTRFTAAVYEGDSACAGGAVTGLRKPGGERLADCEIWLDRGDGIRAIVGTATVALPD